MLGKCGGARKLLQRQEEGVAGCLARPGRLEIRVADEGEHFDMAQLPDPLADENLLRHSGRGILLMQAFMDEFQIRPREPKGTEVKLVKFTAKAD